MIEKTGYCWSCGLLCKDLFCNEKCERKYNRDHPDKTMKGKRAGYGATGSTH